MQDGKNALGIRPRGHCVCKGPGVWQGLQLEPCLQSLGGSCTVLGVSPLIPKPLDIHVLLPSEEGGPGSVAKELGCRLLGLGLALPMSSPPSARGADSRT